MASCLPFFHRWVTVDRVGFVTTLRCSRCGKSRVRVH